MFAALLYEQRARNGRAIRAGDGCGQKSAAGGDAEFVKGMNPFLA